jgi:hypothetical protein
MLRWLKTVVVSDVEKAHVMCQVGIRKTIVVRGVVTQGFGIETGIRKLFRDKSGGCPTCWPGGVRHRGDVSLVCCSRMEQGKACSGYSCPFSGGERECSKRF